MKQVTTEIEIAASPAEVYDVLVDFESYPEWNPFIISAEGEPVVGATLKIVIQPPGGKQMTFKPKVLAAERGKEFRWLGRVLFPGLFDGEHSFKFEELPGGKTKMIHGETFKGLLVGMVLSDPAIVEKGFNALNVALKKRVETK